MMNQGAELGAMKRILSADEMPKIPRAVLKKLVREKFGIAMSNDAADALAAILEKKASSIARYAVKRAQQKKRNMVMEDDIDSYKLRFGG
ncbi:MAG: histone-like protein [Candidatus Micrarchaeia archaeon]